MTTDRRVDLLGHEAPEAPEGPKWTDLSSTTPRGRIYQRIVKRYRTPRTTDRANEGANFVGIRENPAPDWAWMLVRGILQHTATEPDHGEMLVLGSLVWCNAGDAPQRAARILAIDGAMRPTRGSDDDARFVIEVRRLLAEAWKNPNYLPRI